MVHEERHGAFDCALVPGVVFERGGATGEVSCCCGFRCF